MRKDRVKTVPCICEECKIEFLQSPYSVKRGNNRFCSYSCSTKRRHRIISQDGSENPNFKFGGMSNYERKLRFNKRHPEKANAYKIVAAALRSGRLNRDVCEVCGEAKTDAHHEDYAKPLEVNWLCELHHRMKHGATR